MFRSGHVPGAEDGGIELLFLDRLFALRAHGDVVLPDRQGSGVGDAEIDEMMHAEFSARGDGLVSGDQVNGTKLGGLRSRRMRDAYQVDEGVGRANKLAVSVGVQRISGDNFASGGQLGLRAGAEQCANPMVTFKKNGNETAPDVTGSSGDENAPGVGRLGQGFDFQQEPDVGDGCSHSEARSQGPLRMPDSRPVKKFNPREGLDVVQTVSR